MSLASPKWPSDDARKSNIQCPQRPQNCRRLETLEGSAIFHSLAEGRQGLKFSLLDATLRNITENES
jgi:hypothetical protein